MAYQPKITRVRFSASPFSAEQMQNIAESVRLSIFNRISAGLNVNDVPAKPLKPGRNGKKGYPEYKMARGRAPIRDWTWRGKTMRSMAVVAASENRAVIGFTNDEADRIAHFNNRREKAFGVSPKDREVLTASVREVLQTGKIVQVKRVA